MTEQVSPTYRLFTIQCGEATFCLVRFRRSIVVLGVWPCAPQLVQ